MSVRYGNEIISGAIDNVLIPCTLAQYNIWKETDPDFEKKYYAITDDQVGHGVEDYLSYSTNETLTGGTWVNGKPIYKKTIYRASAAVGNWSEPHGIANLDRVIDVTFTCKDSGTVTNGQYVKNRLSSDGNNVSCMGVDNTGIQMHVNSNFNIRLVEWYFTIIYTKTTD